MPWLHTKCAPLRILPPVRLRMICGPCSRSRGAALTDDDVPAQAHVTDSTEESFDTTVLFLHGPSHLCTGMTNEYIFTIKLSYASVFIRFRYCAGHLWVHLLCGFWCTSANSGDKKRGFICALVWVCGMTHWFIHCGREHYTIHGSLRRSCASSLR